MVNGVTRSSSDIQTEKDHFAHLPVFGSAVCQDNKNNLVFESSLGAFARGLIEYSKQHKVTKIIAPLICSDCHHKHNHSDCNGGHLVRILFDEKRLYYCY